MQDTFAPFARPLYVMLKPIGAACNLRCSYCYYLEKSHLYDPGSMPRIDDRLLERFIREYISAQTTPDVLFTWHGGEPLLLPLSFYRKAVALQQRYAGGHRISNALQTNGTLLTEEWCAFLRDNNFLVGISLDGPQHCHDRYRPTATGHPSWERVMDGVRLLNKFGVEWNAMTVVNDYNANHPLEFYRFFKGIGCRYLQFTPIVERELGHADGRHLAQVGEEAAVAPYSVGPRQWGSFLTAVFDEWVRHDVGQIFVELFDCMLANWVGVEPGICVYARQCGHAAVMEHNGDVYSCDHFVFPQYRLGNVRDHTLVEMLYGPRQSQFSRLKRDGLPRQCRECRFEFACHGECPKNRFLTDRYGEPGLNYLCEGYHSFLQHVAPYMDFMAGELASERPPANIMHHIEEIEHQNINRKTTNQQ